MKTITNIWDLNELTNKAKTFSIRVVQGESEKRGLYTGIRIINNDLGKEMIKIKVGTTPVDRLQALLAAFGILVKLEIKTIVTTEEQLELKVEQLEHENLELKKVRAHLLKEKLQLEDVCNYMEEKLNSIKAAYETTMS